MERRRAKELNCEGGHKLTNFIFVLFYSCKKLVAYRLKKQYAVEILETQDIDNVILRGDFNIITFFKTASTNLSFYLDGVRSNFYYK